MTSYNEINDYHKKNSKQIAAIPMAGAIVTAAILLSGLSLIGSYPQALAQQDMTGTTGGAGTEGGGTTGGTTGGAGTEGGGTTGGTTGGATTTDTATTTMGGGNATTGGAGGNDSMSQVRMHLEEARTALQNNDTQGALMHLDLALNAMGGASPIQGNLTGSTGGTGGNMTTGGGTTGGTTGGAGTEGGGGGVLEGVFGGGGQ